MGRKEDNIRLAKDVMGELDRVRNIDIAAHIDHGKTTLSDNLIAGAGMMSEELAGKQLALDFDEEEQSRGITINSASASMVHNYEDKTFLINLIDTPGHVDFGGDVTRAMRAVDGCVIVCCAVEGPMPQTETVVRQALREKVKPVLFINKVDRLINELKVTPEEMQERFVKWITQVNRLIAKAVPAEFRDQWKVNPADGTVAFGSAYNNWAITVPFMQRSGITFKDIIELNNAGETKKLAKTAPLSEVLLDMVITKLPSPKVAQKYRIPHIWHGDPESKAGKAMMETDAKGPVTFMVTKIIVDPHAGEVAFGRIYSGHMERGQELYIAGQPRKNRIQQVSMMVGADRVTVEKVSAGNIAAVTGLKDAMAGSTVTSQEDLEPFERIVHVSDPVVTKAVEAKHMKDLPKLVEVMRMINKGDPSLEVKIDQETGEHLMMGMGELHLEIIEHRVTRDFGLEITTSEPLVVYRECVAKNSKREGEKGFEGKSPNKHNKFYFVVEPMDEKVVKALHDNTIPADAKKHQKEVEHGLIELGWDKDQAKKVKHIQGTNVLVDGTKGVQYLFETMELIKEGFVNAVEKGPLAAEPMQGVKVILTDAKLHEDAIHRGPAQVIPAVRNGAYGAMVRAGRILLEPMQKVVVDVPQDLMGDVTREMQQRRGVIEDMQGEGDRSVITAKAPVSEMFGFSGAIRSATQGRALWSTENLGFEPLDRSLLDKIVAEIRERKGLKPEPFDEDYYAS